MTSREAEREASEEGIRPTTTKEKEVEKKREERNIHYCFSKPPINSDGSGAMPSNFAPLKSNPGYCP